MNGSRITCKTALMKQLFAFSSLEKPRYMLKRMTVFAMDAGRKHHLDSHEQGGEDAKTGKGSRILEAGWKQTGRDDKHNKSHF